MTGAALGIGEASVVNRVVRVVRLYHHLATQRRGLVGRTRAVATGAAQRGLGVVHQRARAPLGIVGRVGLGMAVIAIQTARGQNVWARREITCTQHRRTVLVTTIVAVRTGGNRRRVVRVVLAARPRRRRDIDDGCGQRGGMANIARPCEWNVAMPTPQCGIGRGSRAVVAGRTLASIRGNVGVRGSQPTGR